MIFISSLSVLLTVLVMIAFVLLFSAFIGSITGFSAPLADQLRNVSYQYPLLKFLRQPEDLIVVLALPAFAIILTNSWIKENTRYKTARNLTLVSVFAVTTIQSELNTAASITFFVFIVIELINFFAKDWCKTKGWGDIYESRPNRLDDSRDNF